MTAWQKGGRGQAYTRVPVQNGDPVICGCGTNDPDTVTAIEALVARLVRKRRWKLLGAVTQRPARLTLGDLYDADQIDALDALEASLDDANLTEHLDGWEEWVESNLGKTGTAQLYRMQVSSLVRDPKYPLGDGVEDTRITFRSELTSARVSQWLAKRHGRGGRALTTGYKRKLLYAASSFFSYLRETGILVGDPTSGVKRPKKGRARERWETIANDQKIVDAAPAECRALFALIKATGAEVSAALAMKGRDLELWPTDMGLLDPSFPDYCGLAHVPGTKTETRNRHDVMIEAWARPYLAELARSTSRNAPLFPGLTRYKAHYHHDATARACEVDDYTLRDSRHSWAVRARKRGEPFEVIAENLGTSVAVVHATYARFKIERRPIAPRAVAVAGAPDPIATESATSTPRTEGARRLRRVK